MRAMQVFSNVFFFLVVCVCVCASIYLMNLHALYHFTIVPPALHTFPNIPTLIRCSVSDFLLLSLSGYSRYALIYSFIPFNGNGVWYVRETSSLYPTHRKCETSENGIKQIYNWNASTTKGVSDDNLSSNMV